ncbi:MAG: hypothetical protein WCG36_00230 [bacterium]
MKLPAGKRERMMLLWAMGVAALVACYAIVQWGVVPLFEVRRGVESQLADQREKLKKAKRELDYVPGLQRNFDEVVGKLSSIRATNILRPILASYLVGVSEQVEAAAHATGLRIEDVREGGISEMPHKAKLSSPSSFKVFTVLVYAQGSYDAISRFLQAMEESHPFMCVSEFTITGQTENQEVHRLTAKLEWPLEPATETARETGP